MLVRFISYDGQNDVLVNVQLLVEISGRGGFYPRSHTYCFTLLAVEQGVWKGKGRGPGALWRERTGRRVEGVGRIVRRPLLVPKAEGEGPLGRQREQLGPMERARAAQAKQASSCLYRRYAWKRNVPSVGPNIQSWLGMCTTN